MPQNKLKQKVEGLTNIVKQLIKEVQTNANIAQGTLTALQMHIGKDEWGKLVEELKNVEERRTKKFETDDGDFKYQFRLNVDQFVFPEKREQSTQPAKLDTADRPF